MGYSLWGRQESDTTERLTHTHIWIQHIHIFGNKPMTEISYICIYFYISQIKKIQHKEKTVSFSNNAYLELM